MILRLLRKSKIYDNLKTYVWNKYRNYTSASEFLTFTVVSLSSNLQLLLQLINHALEKLKGLLLEGDMIPDRAIDMRRRGMAPGMHNSSVLWRDMAQKLKQNIETMTVGEPTTANSAQKLFLLKFHVGEHVNFVLQMLFKMDISPLWASKIKWRMHVAQNFQASSTTNCLWKSSEIIWHSITATAKISLTNWAMMLMLW